MRCRAVALFAVVLAVACGDQSFSRGFLIEITNAPGAPAPERLRLVWGDGERVLLPDLVVPAADEPGLVVGAPLPTVFVAAGIGQRRVVVRGMVGTAVVSEGTGMGQVSSGRTTLEVTLFAGRRPDGDGDGVPDAVDPCPQAAGACTRDDGGSPAAGPDATVDRSGVDARSDPAPPDAAAEGRPPDAGPDLGQDVGRDGPVDLAAPDRPQIPALLVGVAVPLVETDVLLQRRLTDLGFAVEVKDDSAARTEDATGKALVVISPSVMASSVQGKFRTVAIPVVVGEIYIVDDMGMAGPIQGVDFAHDRNANQVEILMKGHALAAGLQGTVAVYTQPGPLGWAIPAPTATRIASQPGYPDRTTIFAFDAGVEMMGGFLAPARRVALYSTEVAGVTFTSEGLALFDAAVKWATGR